jgi:predicted nuclease of restriction endonuclease-like RecB superfamily
LKKFVPKSGLEKKVHTQLRRARVSFEYEGTSFPYILARRYIPDFTITTKSGKVIYVEVKGYLRPEDRTKLRAVRAMHPDLDLRILFSRNNKLNTKARMTYTEWADKHGFPWCIGKIPRKWFNE